MKQSECLNELSVMNITGKTRVTGLFGYPVEHTLSPAMHNAAFRHLSLDYCYVPFRVHPTMLADAVRAIKGLDLAGVNVTVPHKESVIPLLDALEPEAEFIGAVNTITHENGILTGYNTDGRGFMRSLEEQDIRTAGSRILIVGTGGACRAISYYLCEQASSLHLFDIDRAKAERLANDLSTVRSTVSLAAAVDITGFDIIINATPLGLHTGDPLPFPTDELKPSQTICDLIYRQTPLLTSADQRGCKTVNGLGMLLWQGALAFELWTKSAAPAEIMRSALLSKIG